MAHEQKNNFYKDNNNLFQYFNPSSKSQSIDQSAASTSNPNVAAKKLNHNAKERDRRRQINSLFSSLRSLLPASDQMDNLNNPATVSVVLKYIPELKQQVEMLEKKKEELSSRISNRQGQADQIIMNNNNNINNYKQGGAAAISTNHVNGREIIIQISSYHKIFLSHILFELEEEYGLQLINATCLHSPQGIFFYTLHLKLVGRTHQRLECQILNNKLLSLFEQKAFS